jgi:transposase InsO family protein
VPADHGAQLPSPTVDQPRDVPDVEADVPGPATAHLSHWLDDVPPDLRARQAPRVKGRRLAKPESKVPQRNLTPQQRLLLLDSWRRSGLPAGDFAALVGISKHTLYAWKKQFELHGPEGLLDPQRAKRQSGRLPELTKRTILMLKESHPEWGCQRISDMLARGPALPACATSVARVLHEAGYEVVDQPTRPHPDKIRNFERAEPNQLWQTDLFTFMLKRQNRRVHLVGFMDDHSRFIVSYGLHASASTALVVEALEAGIQAYGPPEEVLTDNGPQYVTWRGKSQFTRRLEQHGIRQIVARPRRPQTLGKVERFWGTLWREFLETAVFVDLADARTRIGLFLDYYNFQRTHGGIDGLVPADRYFGVATEVVRTLKERVANNALELARHGAPRAPFYMTGQMEGQAFSVHAEGPRLILTRPGQPRQEVELTAPAVADTTPPAEPALPLPICPVVPQLPDGDDTETAGAGELDSDVTENGGDA